MNKYHTVKSSRDFTRIIKTSPYGLDYIIIIRNSYIDFSFSEIDEGYFKLIEQIDKNILKGETHE